LQKSKIKYFKNHILYFVFINENGRMKSLEIFLRRGEGEEGELRRG
jgi:hypothetical protein